MRETPTPGVFPGMTRVEYDSIEALNQSTIKIAHDRSLRHAHWELTHPSEPSDALVDGQAFHAMLLEPEVFKRNYAAMPTDEKGRKHSRRTKLGSEAWAEYEKEHGEKWPIKADRIGELVAMRDSVMQHKIAHDLISNASYTELSAVWEHPSFGFLCKGQIDLVTQYEGWTWVIDVKTCVDASPEAFNRAIAITDTTGPSASAASTTGQPKLAAAIGAAWTVKNVSVKPSAVWKASRLPAFSGGAASATRAENCAESGTTARPQTITTRNVSHGGPPNVNAVAIAAVPLIATAHCATFALPTRSAAKPAAMLASPPAAIATNAVSLANDAASPAGRLAP